MLAKALEVWNLTLQPLDAPEMQCTAQHPEEEDAFICNLQASAIPLLHVLFSNAILALTKPLARYKFYLLPFVVTPSPSLHTKWLSSF